MALLSATGVRADPLLNHNFIVSLIDSSSTLGALGALAGGGILDVALGGFSECTGLEMSMQPEEYKEGGRNGAVLKFPSRITWTNLTLKKGIGIGTALWMVLTWAVALFLGGMFASWFDGKTDRTVGALHGITVWGLSIAVTLLLVALGMTQVAQGGAAVVRGAASVGTAAAGAAGHEGATNDVEAFLHRLHAPPHAPRLGNSVGCRMRP